MEKESVKLRDGIVLFTGKISPNLLLSPMISNSYLLEDEEEIIIFDPSCGKQMAKRLKTYILQRHEAKAYWKKAYVIAGHSHIDHANNFYLSDVLGDNEVHIYVHENGFYDGKVMNDPATFIAKATEEVKKYYNPYLLSYMPYKFLMWPFAILDVISPAVALKLYSKIGAIPWPSPVDGSFQPEPLREENAQLLEFGEIKIKGWIINNKMVLATPGHSPCSVSLLWPERKALFISDADWIGNPVFLSSSLKDCISSLEKMKYLTQTEKVDLLLPAHGLIKEGAENILTHLEYHIRRLEAIRSEVLAAYRSSGETKDLLNLTKTLVNKSPLFKMLKQNNFPRLVLFVHNIVALSLREEGVI